MLHKFSEQPNEFRTVTDESGNGIDFTMAMPEGGLGPPQWDGEYGVDGGGLWFSADATHTNYMQSSRVEWLSPCGTISIWLKATSGNRVGIPFCVSNGFVANKTEFAIQTDALNGKISAWIIVDGVTKWSTATDNGAFVSGSWTNIVITHNGGSPNIYVDGAQVALNYTVNIDNSTWLSSLLNATSPADRLIIGGAPRYYSPFVALGFSGQIDELTVWDNALSASTISEAVFAPIDSLSSQSFSSQSFSSQSSGV